MICLSEDRRWFLPWLDVRWWNDLAAEIVLTKSPSHFNITFRLYYIIFISVLHLVHWLTLVLPPTYFQSPPARKKKKHCFSASCWLSDRQNWIVTTEASSSQWGHEPMRLQGAATNSLTHSVAFHRVQSGGPGQHIMGDRAGEKLCRSYLLDFWMGLISLNVPPLW